MCRAANGNSEPNYDICGSAANVHFSVKQSYLGIGKPSTQEASELVHEEHHANKRCKISRAEDLSDYATCQRDRAQPGQSDHRRKDECCNLGWGKNDK